MTPRDRRLCVGGPLHGKRVPHQGMKLLVPVWTGGWPVPHHWVAYRIRTFRRRADGWQRVYYWSYVGRERTWRGNHNRRLRMRELSRLWFAEAGTRTT